MYQRRAHTQHYLSNAAWSTCSKPLSIHSRRSVSKPLSIHSRRSVAMIVKIRDSGINVEDSADAIVLQTAGEVNHERMYACMYLCMYVCM